MSLHAAVLTDVASGTYVDQIHWGPAADVRLAGSDQWSLSKRRLHGGVSEGVDVVELNNGAMSVQVLPTRGMGLWRGVYKGHELGWKSPVAQPVHPSYVDQQARGGIGWLGGFNEWLCRCGLASFGPPTIDRIKDAAGNVVSETALTLHGRIANIAAHRVSVELDTSGPGTLRVIGEVDETMLFGPCLRLRSTVETEAGSNKLTILDEVTNLSGSPGELCLLYHINIGKPFLDANSQLVAAYHEAAPRDAHAAADNDRFATYLGPTAGYREQCYFFRPAATEGKLASYLLKNAGSDLGMSVRFDPKQLPWFTLWKNTQADRDGYCTGLEPGTGFPNPKSYEREQGRVVSLPPGGKWSTRLELVVHAGAAAVAEAENLATAPTRGKPGTLHSKPLPNWTA